MLRGVLGRLIGRDRGRLVGNFHRGCMRCRRSLRRHHQRARTLAAAKHARAGSECQHGGGMRRGSGKAEARPNGEGELARTLTFGINVGVSVGAKDGSSVGIAVGAGVGALVGAAVGASVQ